MKRRPALSRRSGGILLHLTSLPGPHGIGDLGPAALRFCDFLAGAGQSWWQMLPVGPTGAANAPYQATSSFAGNPLLISLDRLAGEGLLDGGDLAPDPDLLADRVDYGAVIRFKGARLKKAFDLFEERGDARAVRAFEKFGRQEAGWLDDFALYAALKKANHGCSWTSWEKGARRRDPEALARAREEMKREIRFHRFLQWVFRRQWRELRRHAERRGIGLIGDVPIFVAHDSADVWANPDLFDLDEEGLPLHVAGVPPDYFNKDGQRWGNPLYRWDVLRRRGFDWWIERMRGVLELFDAVRVDHFIGFVRYWEIPAQAPTAREGRFVPGPGSALFTRLEKALGKVPVIAEDLGIVIPAVTRLRTRFGFPGMRVLQFAFGDPGGKNPHLPENHPENSVAYTGTHDNNTTVGWWNETGLTSSTRSDDQIRREKERAAACLATDGREVHWDFIRAALRSRARTAIVPLQDLLGLGPEGRMNRPGIIEGNWEWRCVEDALVAANSGRLLALARETKRGRRPKSWIKK